MPVFRFVVRSLLLSGWVFLSLPALATEYFIYASHLSLDKPGFMPAGRELNYYCTNGVAPRADADAPVWHECKNSRVFASKGDTLDIVYVSQGHGACGDLGPDVKLQITQHARWAVLGSIVFPLLSSRAVESGRPVEPEGLSPPLCFFHHPHVLEDQRSWVSIGNAPDLQAASPLDRKLYLTTGPKEPWYLSADLVFVPVKKQQFDAQANRLAKVNHDVPLYFSVNWLLGDVYGRYGPLARERWMGKLMLAPSHRPFDAFGLGLGYRFGDSVHVDKSLSVFAGSFWTRGDRLDAQGGVNRGGLTQSWSVGMSCSAVCWGRWAFWFWRHSDDGMVER